MNQPTRIAIAAGVHVTKLFAFAVVLIAAAESAHWASMWWEARNE